MPTIITTTTSPNVLTSSIVTTIAATAPSTTSTSSTYIPGLTRPAIKRGRPPGSKNVNQTFKADQMAKLNTLAAQPYLPPNLLSAALSKATHLDASIKTTVAKLFNDTNFMNALMKFQEPTSMNTFLTKYFSLSNQGDVNTLTAAFTEILYTYYYMASTLAAPTTSLASTTVKQTSMAPPAKNPKLDISSLSKSSSSMSIFATTSKSHISTASLPSQTTITPTMKLNQQSSSAGTSLLKSNASTIISVGSGQLTITPSISITPNPLQTSSATQITPVTLNPSQQKPPKPKKVVDPSKPKRKSSNAQLQQPRIPPISSIPPIVYPDLGVKFPLDLPKSLSIIPTANTYTTKHLLQPSMNKPIDQPPKITKPKKKSLDTDAAVKPKKLNTQNNPMSAAKMQEMTQMTLLNQYKEMIRSGGPDYMSQFEQFLSMPMQVSQLTKDSKAMKMAQINVASGQHQAKGTIKVKQIDQLQGATITSVPMKAAPKATQKSKQQFQTPNLKMPSTSSILNAYGTTISTLPQSAAQMPYLPTSTTIAANSLAASLQIRYLIV